MCVIFVVVVLSISICVHRRNPTFVTIYLVVVVMVVVIVDGNLFTYHIMVSFAHSIGCSTLTQPLLPLCVLKRFSFGLFQCCIAPKQQQKRRKKKHKLCKVKKKEVSKRVNKKPMHIIEI